MTTMLWSQIQQKNMIVEAPIQTARLNALTAGGDGGFVSQAGA